jgi:hypothetical protein
VSFNVLIFGEALDKIPRSVQEDNPQIVLAKLLGLFDNKMGAYHKEKQITKRSKKIATLHPSEILWLHHITELTSPVHIAKYQIFFELEDSDFRNAYIA